MNNSLISPNNPAGIQISQITWEILFIDLFELRAK